MYDKLLRQFGESDVYRQYSDGSRYPFNCDFYIKSRDLFIEVNNHPSHGGHPYDPNSEEDRKTLEELRSDGGSWARMIIDVWTVRDRLKFQTAQANKLNYLVIYRSVDELIIE